MSDLLHKIESAVCKIDGCVASAGSLKHTSLVYGRDDKAEANEGDLTALLFLKNRLNRHKDVFLTDNCKPALCSFDGCKKRVDIDCDDLVEEPKFLTTDERWRFNQYIPDRGAMISMSKADDDGTAPVSYTRVRFYEWDTCANTTVAVSAYIDVPDVFADKFIYNSTLQRYYVSGPDWIVELDSTFNVLSTNSYGGTRSWRGCDLEESRNELYMVDNAGNEFDIIDLTTMTITSTTLLPQGATATEKPRQCRYHEGLVFITGFGKMWTVDPTGVTATLVRDERDLGSNIERGSLVSYPDGTLGILIIDIVTGLYSVEKWNVVSGTPVLSSTNSLGISYYLGAGGIASLAMFIDVDTCGNTFISGVSTNQLIDDKSLVVVYDKDFERQDSITKVGGTFGIETSHPGNYDPVSGRYFLISASPDNMQLVLTMRLSDGNKVTVYPNKCQLTDDQVCSIINSADKLCNSICGS